MLSTTLKQSYTEIQVSEFVEVLEVGRKCLFRSYILCCRKHSFVPVSA
jgi:hypothetical protein